MFSRRHLEHLGESAQYRLDELQSAGGTGTKDSRVHVLSLLQSVLRMPRNAKVGGQFMPNAETVLDPHACVSQRCAILPDACVDVVRTPCDLL